MSPYLSNRLTSKVSVVLLTAGLALSAAGCASNNGNAGSPASGSPSAAVPSASSTANPSPTVPAVQSPSASPSASPQGNPFEVAGVTDPDAMKQVFEVLKTAVAKDDKQQAAECALFPIRINKGKQTVEIKSKSEFVDQYDQIFTTDVKKALAAQQAEKLFANQYGVMAGDGEIWFGSTADTPQQYGIIAVNTVAGQVK